MVLGYLLVIYDTGVFDDFKEVSICDEDISILYWKVTIV